MLPRLWIVLLALLLLAAPAGSTFAETADASSSISLCDDDIVTHVEVPRADGPPHRTACVTRPEDTVPPAPVLARIFRPPRPSLA
jgi:hypothetical protein